jgi:hypothetical protein
MPHYLDHWRSIPAVAIHMALWMAFFAASLGAVVLAHRGRGFSAGATSRVGRLSLLLAGVMTFFDSLVAGALVGGPLVRAVFGPPLDFLSDNTSPQAELQAILIQAGAALLAFGLLGALIGKRDPRASLGRALWAANPASLLVGAIAWVIARHCAERTIHYEWVPYEYVSASLLWFHSAAAYGVYAAAFVAGARLTVRRARRARPG